jgi:hypothetical protein
MLESHWTNKRMRNAAAVCVAWALATGSAITLGSTAQGADLLARARQGVGGAERLSAIRTLSIVGERSVRNELFGHAPDAKKEFEKYSLELRALWPDRYIRVDTWLPVSGTPVRPSVRGFVGSDSVRPGDKQINLQRFNFARLMLLLVLRTDTATSLSLGPSPGKNTLKFVGQGGFECLLDLDAATAQPVQLRFIVKRVDDVGLPTGEVVGEEIMRVESRRVFGGISVPDHVSVRLNGRLVEESWYRDIKINPRLTDADFKR